QKQGSAALNAIAAEDEAATSDRHRHFLVRQRVEKFRQLSMKPLNRMSALIHRSGLATARASIDLRRRARNIRTLARLGHHRRSDALTPRPPALACAPCTPRTGHD